MADEKKSKRNIIIIIAAVLLLLGAVGSCTGNNDQSSSTSSDATSSNDVVAFEASSASSKEEANNTSEAATSSEPTEATTQTIELVAGEQGDYGQELVMSAGTEFEEHLIVYYLPGGNYSVKNLGERPTQVSVYEGIQPNEDGWDEYTDAITPLLLDPDQTEDLNIPDGWFIEIHEPTHIELTPKA